MGIKPSRVFLTQLASPVADAAPHRPLPWSAACSIKREAGEMLPSWWNALCSSLHALLINGPGWFLPGTACHISAETWQRGHAMLNASMDLWQMVTSYYILTWLYGPCLQGHSACSHTTFQDSLPWQYILMLLYSNILDMTTLTGTKGVRLYCTSSCGADIGSELSWWRV